MTHSSKKVNANGVCVIILAILVVMVLWNMQRSMTMNNYQHQVPRFPAYISGMLGRFTSARTSTQARREEANGATVVDQLLSTETNETIKSANKVKVKVHNPTSCTDATCENYKEGVSETEKVKNDSKVIELMKKFPNALVLIWAPWCPHCHNAIPLITEDAKKMKTPVVLVNSELVTTKIMTGADAPAGDVTHFPFIAQNKKLYEGSMDPDAIKAFCDSSAKDSSNEKEEPVTKPTGDTPVVEETNLDTSMNFIQDDTQGADISPEEQLNMMF